MLKYFRILVLQGFIAARKVCHWVRVGSLSADALIGGCQPLCKEYLGTLFSSVLCAPLGKSLTQIPNVSYLCLFVVIAGRKEILGFQLRWVCNAHARDFKW